MLRKRTPHVQENLILVLSEIRLFEDKSCRKYTIASDTFDEL